MPKKITDKMRLDWLMRRRASITHIEGEDSVWWEVQFGLGIEAGASPRLAIDFAIRAERKEKGR